MAITRNIQDYYKNIQNNNPYALSTDTQAIKSVYDQATAAAQAVEERAIMNAENAWQRNLASTQATALDTIRKNNASAIATGASKGMQAANELSAVLGLQDTAVEESTALAQQRLDLADAYAAEYAKNAVTAQEMANTNKQAMMSAAMQQYGYDTELAAQEMIAKWGSPDVANMLYADELEKQADAIGETNSTLADSYRNRATAIREAVGVDQGAYETTTIKPGHFSLNSNITIGDSSYTLKSKVTNATTLAALDERGLDTGTAVKYNNTWYVKGKGGTVYKVG